MARIRSVHPGFFTDEAFVTASRDARLLFIGLLCEADDSGVFEWKPLGIKMRVFPADAIDVAALLAELAALDILRPFTGDGKPYGAIRNFGRYQRPKFPKRVHPLPDDMRAFVAADGKAEPGAMNPPRDLSAADRKRKQRERNRDDWGNGHASSVTVSTKRGNVPPDGGWRVERDKSLWCDSDAVPLEKPIATKPSRKATNEDFERFRAVYPKRDGTDPKEPARKRFEAAVKSGADPDLIITGASAFAAAEQKRGNVGSRFIPHSSSWLNRRGWEDHQVQSPENPAAETESWRMPVESWRRNPMTWNSHAWGPPPGEPGCKVPRSVLAGLGRVEAQP